MARGIGLALLPGEVEPDVFEALAENSRQARGMAWAANVARREAAMLAQLGIKG